MQPQPDATPGSLLWFEVLVGSVSQPVVEASLFPVVVVEAGSVG